MKLKLQWHESTERLAKIVNNITWQGKVIEFNGSIIMEVLTAMEKLNISFDSDQKYPNVVINNGVLDSFDTLCATPMVYVQHKDMLETGSNYGVWVGLNNNAGNFEYCCTKAFNLYEIGFDMDDLVITNTFNMYGIDLSEENDLNRLMAIGLYIEEHGLAYKLFYHFFDAANDYDRFDDAYVTMCESEQDFVGWRLEQDEVLPKLIELGIEYRHLDLESIAADWFSSNYHSEIVGYRQCYVFNSCID